MQYSRNMIKKDFLSKGVTLIELLITMGVLSVLISGMITVVDPVTQFRKARDAQRKSDLSQIQKGLEQYYQDLGRYPGMSVSNEILKVDSTVIAWGSPWSPYMNILPDDPVSDSRYVYYVDENTNGQAYLLYANLERGSNDSQACLVSPCGSWLPTGAEDCGEGAVDKHCNYGVSSPNISVD